ncbi:MAG: SprT family zinc-dependent metalloprotease [Methanomicrobiaceae archaeon]|nr:SprT family zinc-dependent metalloprotease [Methanomicrobiaceae archaeon]
MEGSCEQDMIVRRRPGNRMSLRLLPDGQVQVTAPPGEDITDFLEKNREWIKKRKNRLEMYCRGHEHQRDRLLLDGSYYDLSSGCIPSLDDDAKVATYVSPTDLFRMLRQRLHENAESLVLHHSGVMGLRCRGIQIRRQRSRWASCSLRGTLSLNLRIIALPLNVREYVIVHELAHLKEANHSPAFWAVVERYYPHWKDAEHELKRFWFIIARNRIWKILEGC